MRRLTAAGLAFVSFHTITALADTTRGNEAFSQGYYFTASREWRAGAEAGDASAMLSLGTLYDTGHGLPQDFAKALSWYQRAAEAGNAAAMFNVGAMYDNGRGTNVDRAEAIKWYAMAANKGNGRAAYAAATIYRDGDGVPRDDVAAVKYFRIAAAAGIEAALPNLTSLDKSAPSRSAANVSRPAETPSKVSSAPAVAAKRPAPAQAPAPVQSAAINAAPARSEPLRQPPAPLPAAKASAAAPQVVASLTPPAPPALPPKPTASPIPEQPSAAQPPADMIDAPVAAAKPSPPQPEQPISPVALASEIESFHKAALQRTNISPVTSKQYDEVIREITHRAVNGSAIARYDAGFAYERGIGTSSDPVKSYVYYILATLSPDADVKSAALKGAFEVGGRLSDAQHASAADMLTHGIP